MNLIKFISKYIKRSGKEGGYTTAEMLIAFFIMTVAISGVSTIAFGNQSVSVDTEKNSEALRIAQAVAEGKRAMAKTNFDGLQSSDCDMAGYECEVLVSSPQQNLKQITTTVSWTEGNRPQSVVIKSRVANLEEEEALGNGNPGGDPSGKVLGEDENGGGGSGGSSGGSSSVCPVVEAVGNPIDIGEGSVAKGLDVMGEFTYLAVRPNSPEKNDFYIVHTNNYQNPAITNYLSTESGGVNAVDVAQVGEKIYAYLATQKSNGQLQIVDVTDPNPSDLLPISSIGLSGNVAAGLSVFYRKDLNSDKSYVYIGTAKNDSNELYIIDVTNPINPEVVSSFDVEADVNKIFVRGTSVYLATGDFERELVILNISDSLNLSLVGDFSSTGANGSKAFYNLGNKIYLGAFAGSAGSGQGDSPAHLFVLNVNGNSLSKVGSLYRSGMAPSSLVVNNNMAFVSNDAQFSAFQVVDVSDPSAPKHCLFKDLSAAGTGLYYSNTWAYVSLFSRDGLKIVKLK